MIVLYAKRIWVRVLGVLYPVSTILVVMITANHYILDAVAIMVVIGIAVTVVYAPWSAVYAQVFVRRDVRAVRAESAEDGLLPESLPRLAPALVPDESDR
jgi:hypothetical protein